MRRALALTIVAVMASASAVLAASPGIASVAAAGEATGAEEALFTVQSLYGTTKPARGSSSGDETFLLILTGVDPVTKFANRPFRDATLISPKALVANWDAWFADDPPNAVVTYLRPGRAPASMVVELMHPTYAAATRSLSFTAIRIARKHDPMEKGANWQRRTTPSTMNSVSLFIDLSKWDKKEP